MRILIWGINYAPEMTGIGVYNQMLAEWLVRQGHEVEVLTTFAYYPAWRKQPQDQWRWWATEEIAGVTVRRCWHYVPRRPRTLLRMLHELSFVVISSFRSLWLRRPDMVFFASPPVVLAPSVALFCWLRRTRFTFHVQDLQPDAAIALGMLKPGLVTQVLLRMKALGCRCAARVSGISDGMLEALREKGISEEKLLFFPNPVLLPERKDLPARGSFRRAHGIGEASFVVLYSGNIGRKQGLDLLVEAASHLRAHAEIEIIICGDGNQREELVATAQAQQLSNVRFLPLQPKAHFSAMLIDADVCAILQLPGTGRVFFPSKLLNILGHARPVLTLADSASALFHAVEEGGFGYNVSEPCAVRLAEAIVELSQKPTLLESYAQKGRAYVQRFERDTVLTRINQELFTY